MFTIAVNRHAEHETNTLRVMNSFASKQLAGIDGDNYDKGQCWHGSCDIRPRVDTGSAAQEIIGKEPLQSARISKLQHIRVKPPAMQTWPTNIVKTYHKNARHLNVNINTKLFGDVPPLSVGLISLISRVLSKSTRVRELSKLAPSISHSIIGSGSPEAWHRNLAMPPWFTNWSIGGSDIVGFSVTKTNRR